jgi:hypothetical protein
MTNFYPSTAFGIGIGGYAWITYDGDVNQIGLSFTDSSWTYTDNTSIIQAIDSATFPINSALGVHEANVTFSGQVSIDRSWDVIINKGFGSRVNGQLVPWMATVKPGGAFTAYTAGRIWFSTLTLSGSWAEEGQQAVVRYDLALRSMDPDNYYGVPAVETPTTQGVTGTNFSTFVTCKFTNGYASSSPSYIEYDGIRSFSLSLDNRLMVIPSNDEYYSPYRIAAGCVPGAIVGSRFEISQLKGATNLLPVAPTDSFPLNIIIYSPDRTHNLEIDLSVKRITDGQGIRVEDFTQNNYTYGLFSTSSVNSTSTVNFPFNAIYT